ncbi:TFB1 [Candida theae]|uniref:TFB1 n=1 Tax=Candida theae TaxID=1198502 RepID=A0AAD5G0T3_9ASCO|nr:TFB1 [Candida theae]KAI5968066.1 TFB1 [Candida theae]
MDVIRGACSKDKVGGMVYIREDIVPSMLEWKAVEDEKNTLAIPLNKLVALQASKESSPKMMLKISYKLDDQAEQEPTKMTLHFNNRPTMNNIKDALQTIVARSRTRVEGSSITPTPQSEGSSRPGSSSGTPRPGLAGTATESGSSTTPGAASISSAFNLTHEQLTDASLLKNFELQQKLLLEDKNLRNTFTKSVMQFKLSPTMFWSSRINQLRTFALTISQHRGPYNVLSTIKPVATSDNQVNVNVTRSTISEIFDIYPIIKKAFTDLVPQKLSEGEFWSRFFNSKLFRRLRGDKIGLYSGRGDVILDKYLYIDEDSLNEEHRNAKRGEEEEANSPKRQKLANADPNTGSSSFINEPPVNKFLDLFGNQEDNSQKLGNRPDMTMRYEDDATKALNIRSGSSGRENEMIILMKNMNKLSSKMMSMSGVENPAKPEKAVDGLSAAEVNEYEEELDLHDLNMVNETKYVKLNINSNNIKPSGVDEDDSSSSNNNNPHDGETINVEMNDFNMVSYLQGQIPTQSIIDLSDTFKGKEEDISKTSIEISQLVRQNYKTFKSVNKEDSLMFHNPPHNIVPDAMYQEIITYNITIVEFLSHFWKLFLNGNNPTQLKKLFTSIKNCQVSLTSFKEKSLQQLDAIDIVTSNEKLKDKIHKDFDACLEPMEISLSTALKKYAEAVKKANTREQNGSETQRETAS